MILENKKILFFSPKFFGYEKNIVKEMVKQGAEVDYFDERPNNDTLTKALIRINKKFLKKKIDQYYNLIIENVQNNQYDYVFFIVPESISRDKLIELKKHHSKAVFILYMWDSIKNKKNIIDILDQFDKLYTFDKKDQNIDNRFKFRPLFYVDEYSEISTEKKFKYDYTFIGTVHGDRYPFLSQIEKYAKENELNSYLYMYFPSKLLYLFRRIFSKEMKGAKYQKFQFDGLSFKKVIDIIKHSKIIIDIQHIKQSGLTIRTIEMLGAKRKLITTNNNVMEYDFYTPNNILIVNRENPILDFKDKDDFFYSDFMEIDEAIYNNYSVSGWLNEIING